MNLTFFVASGLFAIGVTCINFAVFFMQRHPAFKALKRTPEQIEAAWRSNAKDETQFVDEMCDMLRGMLTKGGANYRNWDCFHGNVQRMLLRALNDMIPQLPEFTKEDHGKQHFQPMWVWIQKYGTHEEQERFVKFAQHVGFW